MKVKREALRCALWHLCVGVVISCDWRPLPDNYQQAPSFDAGAQHLAWRLDISDPEACRAACCSDYRCQMALLGFPADGVAQCRLIRCVIDGRNMCQLEPDDQFQLVGWKEPLVAVPLNGDSKPSPKENEDGPLLAVPLLDVSEPVKNDSTNPCLQPMKVGSCRAAFPKFYYDVDNQTCRSFIYGGCEGNGNNFDSLQDCEANCSGVTGSVVSEESAAGAPMALAKAARMVQAFPDQSVLTYDDYTEDKAISAEEYSERCEAEPLVGPCRAAFRHWYYDSQLRECKTFIYGGCQGNKNNYESQQSCLDSCHVDVVPAPKKHFQADSPSKEECLSAPDTGPCRAAFSLFYYDPATESCQSFIYGGCGGNKNRYNSAEECLTRCSGITDGSFDGRDQTRTRWTAAFFVLLTLAAICTVLVSTLVVTMLRRLTVSRRASIVSDKEELLPEVRSSWESLNVPALPTTGKA